jgi:predicted metal-dependent hydrolase
MLLREHVEAHDLFPGLIVHYQWKQKKNLSMRLYPDQKLVVRSPAHLQLDRLRAFVSDHREWIEGQLRRTPAPSTRHVHFGDVVHHLGTPLLLTRCGDRRLDGETDGILLWHHCPEPDSERDLGTWLKAWYRRQAEGFLPQRLAELQHRLPLTRRVHIALTLRWMKRRWGSCRRDGRITLNTALMICPVHLIDYVIVHELAHLEVPSHQPPFYRLLETWLPGAMALKKEMNRDWNCRMF